jgi:hypothetical protein
MATWRDKLPEGWGYRLWTNEDLARVDWHNRERIEQMREWNGKADIMRWEILLKYGGILVDADSECVAPLDDSFLEHDNFACWENETCRPGLIAAGYVGAIPGSPLMHKIVQAVHDRPLVGMAWESVGPKLLTEMADETLHVYPARTFIPRHFSGVEALGDHKIYAKQHWGSTLGYPSAGFPAEPAPGPGLAKAGPIAGQRAAAVPPGTQIDIGIPAYRDISVRTVLTILGLLGEAAKFGINVQFGCVNGIAVVELARSEVVGQFLAKSVGTHLLMLDADIAIEPANIMAMVLADRDILAAPVLTKKGVWAFRPLDPDLLKLPIATAKNGLRLAEVGAAGCAAMLVKRQVLERMVAAHPELLYSAPVGDAPRAPYANIFHGYHVIMDGNPEYVGEDFAFVERAKALGYKCELAVDILVEHAGHTEGLAQVLEHLRQQKAQGTYQPPTRVLSANTPPPPIMPVLRESRRARRVRERAERRGNGAAPPDGAG